MTTMSTPRIVCAALLDRRAGVLIIGPRHYDSTMIRQMDFAYGHGQRPSAEVIEQGFIDQYGTFWDRRQAMILAKASGQPIKMEYCTPKDQLFSEGLY